MGQLEFTNLLPLDLAFAATRFCALHSRQDALPVTLHNYDANKRKGWMPESTDLSLAVCRAFDGEEFDLVSDCKIRKVLYLVTI